MRTAFCVVACLTFAACGDDHDEESYDNLPDCVEDHVAEGLTEVQAVTHCLVDYDFPPDFADQAACVAYVSGEGFPDSADAGCMAYFEETGA
jgi:hypothetical protein